MLFLPKRIFLTCIDLNQNVEALQIIIMFVYTQPHIINATKIETAKIYCEITDADNLDDGRPILLLLPGGPGFDHVGYKGHSRGFEEFAHVVYIDPRGCGKSSPCSQNIEYSIQVYIEDVEAVRKHFGFEKIFLLGTSYGSMVAQGYAIKYHQYLQGLILIGGAPSYAFLSVAQANLNTLGTTEQKQICRDLLWQGNFKSKEDVATFFRIMTPLYSKKTESKIAPYSTVNCSIEHVNQAYRTHFWSFDFTASLKHISCKTLILFGKHDWVNDPRFAKLIASQIPRSELHIFPDCGHSVAIDQPGAYLSAVRKFISSC